MAPRKPKQIPLDIPETLNQRLSRVLKFIAVCQTAKGTEQATHCFMGNNQAVAFNGVIAAGMPIELDIFAAPHTFGILNALEQCGAELVITQIAVDRLMLRAGEFQAVIPCIDPTKLSAAFPDAPVAVVSDSLRAAFAIVEPLVSDKAAHVTTACVQLRSGSVVGTNGEIILEVWHGVDLPHGLLVPKAALTAIRKTKKPLAAFGFSTNTATFYFEDQSWIRTQLYTEKYSNVDYVLVQDVIQRTIPAGFFDAIARAGKFSADGYVYCGQGRISSHDPNDQNALGSRQGIDVPGVTDTRIYSVKNAAIMAKYAEWMDDQAREGLTYFGGKTIRGALEHKTIKPPMPTIAQIVEGPYDITLWEGCRQHGRYVEGCEACLDTQIPF